MADKIENHALHLLREIREEIAKLHVKVDSLAQGQDTEFAKPNAKLDKQGIELVGVRGRVRKVEETLESIARVMSEGILIDR